MNDSPVDPQDPTPTQIERAMTGYLPQYKVAELLGVTGSAVSNRTADFRREQGGIQVPGGWLYSIERLAQGGWVPAERLPTVPTYKVAMPTSEAIERALSRYMTQRRVARDLLGISSAALAKRADWIKREMGGVLTPNGWLYDPERLQQHEPLRGRPTEERRAATPVLDVDSMPRYVDKPVTPVYTAKMDTPKTPKTPKSDPDEITTPVLSVRLPSLELRRAVTEKCRAEGTSVAAFIAMACEALVDGRLRIIEPAPPAKPSFLIPADSPDAAD